MRTTFLKRFAAKATLGVFIGSQLAGCLAMPSNHDAGRSSTTTHQAGQVASSAQGMRNAETAASVHQGEQRTTVASVAPGSMTQLIGGLSPLGNPNVRYANPNYASADFQRLKARVIQAAGALNANPSRYTKGQFFAFSGAAADLMRYVDAVESRREGLSSRPANQSRVMVAPDARPAQQEQSMEAVLKDVQDGMVGAAIDHLGDPSGAALAMAKRFIVSRKGKDALTMIPALGNALGVAMQLSGKSLDGSDMEVGDGPSR